MLVWILPKGLIEVGLMLALLAQAGAIIVLMVGMVVDCEERTRWWCLVGAVAVFMFTVVPTLTAIVNI